MPTTSQKPTTRFQICIKIKMLRSISTLDLLSIKQLNQTERFPSINSFSMSKKTNRLAHGSSSSKQYEIPRTVSALNFDVTLSYIKNYNSSINDNKRDVTAVRDIISSMIVIDGPATQALDCSLRKSKRRSVTKYHPNHDEDNTNSHDGSSTTKRTRLDDTTRKSLISHQLDCTTYKIPLLQDWNNMYRCLIKTTHNDDDNDNSFPLIECDFDDVDTTHSDIVHAESL
jgi:hypothetical protein